MEGGRMIHAGWPLPERPGSLDAALDRGWDPKAAEHDRVTPEPLGEDWQTWLDRSVVAAKHRRELDGDDRCGTRCDRCDDRTCQIDGPELRACGVTCVDCPCSCTACERQREDMRADLQHRVRG